MKKYYMIIVFLALASVRVTGQESTSPTIKFGGYINWTAIYDSRQIVSARESHFLLYPKAEEFNSSGQDINNFSNTQMSIIQTRTSASVTGLKFLGAETNGLLEAEFMGNSDTDVNGFRVRHAFVNMKWGTLSLLAGQYWIPFFNTDMYPDQIGSNGGAPFQPFARSPQLRVTHQNSNMKALIALVAQRDFASSGPNGTSSEYLRNGVLPDVQMLIQFNFGKSLAGAGAEFKRLKPGLKSGTSFYSEEYVSSYALNAFTKLSTGAFSFKLSGIYGTNLTDYTMLGGYAVSSTDLISKTITYTPIKVYSVWGELTYGTALEAGIFAGYTKNLGTDDLITGAYYCRGNNVDYVLRIAPRLQYKEGNLKWSLELEHTTAAYGTPDGYGKINSSVAVSNLRIYTALFYYFSI